MNITAKIIITDTNIITDLDNAKILDKFVTLDNVYISDMIKNDEVKSSTGDISIINKFKEIKATGEQLQEVNMLSRIEKKLSLYDLLNFVIARDNNCILAIGDNKLKTFSENKGVEVIRTLKLILLMVDKKIITIDKAIKACELLKTSDKVRIPNDDIDNTIVILKNQIVTNK